MKKGLFMKCLLLYNMAFSSVFVAVMILIYIKEGSVPNVLITRTLSFFGLENIACVGIKLSKSEAIISKIGKTLSKAKSIVNSADTEESEEDE